MMSRVTASVSNDILRLTIYEMPVDINAFFSLFSK